MQLVAKDMGGLAPLLAAIAGELEDSYLLAELGGATTVQATEAAGAQRVRVRRARGTAPQPSSAAHAEGKAGAAAQAATRPPPPHQALDPAVLHFGAQVLIRNLHEPSHFLSAATGGGSSSFEHGRSFSGASVSSATLPRDPDELSVLDSSVQAVGDDSASASEDASAMDLRGAALAGTGTGRSREVWELLPAPGADPAAPMVVGSALSVRCTKTGRLLGIHEGSGAVHAGGVLGQPGTVWQLTTPLHLARRAQARADSTAPPTARAGEPFLLSPQGQPHSFLAAAVDSGASAGGPALELQSLQPVTNHLLGRVALPNPAEADASPPTAPAPGTLAPACIFHADSGGPTSTALFTSGLLAESTCLTHSPAWPAGLALPGCMLFAAALPHTATVPLWALCRPSATAADVFVLPPPEAAAPPLELGRAPPSLQEASLVEDVLDVLLGFPGRYIQPALDAGGASPPHAADSTAPDRVAFHLIPSGGGSPGPSDVSARSLVQRMLPLAEQLVACRRFVERRSLPGSGKVAQALAAALGQVVSEVERLVAQLEEQHRMPPAAGAAPGLSLQGLWYHLQPAARTVRTLHACVQQSQTACGGALLHSLYLSWLQAGDETSKALFHFALAAAARPFLAQVAAWVFTGRLPEGAAARAGFAVQEQVHEKASALSRDYNAAFWEQRVCLDARQLPGFLESHGDALLTAGKYLYALRLCGVAAECPGARDIPFSTDPAAYSEVLGRAMQHASSRLMHQVMQVGRLPQRLDSMKALFLMSSGDFLSAFMDSAGEELAKEVDPASGLGLTTGGGVLQDAGAAGTASLQRLRGLLDLALRGLPGIPEEDADAVSCTLGSMNLVQHIQAVHAEARGEAVTRVPRRAGEVLKGYAAFTLDFAAAWPLTLVLSKRSMTKYQLLFRHLFFCRYVERVLCDCWQAHQEVKGLNLTSTLARSYALRQRMLHFLQNFIYYCTFEVFEPRWHEMQEGLRSCKTIDEVIRVHCEFLNTGLKECLLTSLELLRLLNKLVTLCFLFATQLNTMLQSAKLSPEEIDARAGITPEQAAAMAKARAARRRRAEQGLAYGRARHFSATGSQKAQAFSVGTKPGRKTLAERIDEAAQPSDPSILSDVAVRTKRARVQIEAIEHQMGQAAWQRTMEKSGQLFNSFLRTFMDKLDSRAERELGSRLRQLLARLDFNGFYAGVARGT